MKPGWGKPVNQSKSEPLHWWTAEGQRACKINDPQDHLRFTGKTEVSGGDGAVWIPAHACHHCTYEIRRAETTLGVER